MSPTSLEVIEKGSLAHKIINENEPLKNQFLGFSDFRILEFEWLEGRKDFN